MRNVLMIGMLAMLFAASCGGGDQGGSDQGGGR